MTYVRTWTDRVIYTSTARPRRPQRPRCPRVVSHNKTIEEREVRFGFTRISCLGYTIRFIRIYGGGRLEIWFRHFSLWVRDCWGRIFFVVGGCFVSAKLDRGNGRAVRAIERGESESESESEGERGLVRTATLRYLLDTTSNLESEKPARAIRIRSCGCERWTYYTWVTGRGTGLRRLDWTGLRCIGDLCVGAKGGILYKRRGSWAI